MRRASSYANAIKKGKKLPKRKKRVKEEVAVPWVVPEELVAKLLPNETQASFNALAQTSKPLTKLEKENHERQKAIAKREAARVWDELSHQIIKGVHKNGSK